MSSFVWEIRKGCFTMVLVGDKSGVIMLVSDEGGGVLRLLLREYVRYLKLYIVGTSSLIID